MKEFLETLLATGVAANDQVNSLISAGGLPLVAHPEQIKLSNIEHLLETKTRFRGCFETNSIVDFIKYVSDQELKDAKVFVNTISMTANALFDIGDAQTPLHCDHKGFFSPTPTALLKAINNIVDKTLTQRDLTDFIEDWFDEVTILVDEGDGNHSEVRAAQAIASIRSVTIEAKSSQTHSEGSFSASRSAMDEIEARSAVDRLPDHLAFSVIPYDGFNEQLVYLRISLMTGSEKPMFKLRWVGHESQIEKISDEMVQRLNDALPDNLPIYKGDFTSR